MDQTQVINLPSLLRIQNWPPRYNWNIVESGVKHRKTKTVFKILTYTTQNCSIAQGTL